MKIILPEKWWMKLWKMKIPTICLKIRNSQIKIKCQENTEQKKKTVVWSPTSANKDTKCIPILQRVTPLLL